MSPMAHHFFFISRGLEGPFQLQRSKGSLAFHETVEASKERSVEHTEDPEARREGRLCFSNTGFCACEDMCFMWDGVYMCTF